jgi:hypothetical protein
MSRIRKVKTGWGHRYVLEEGDAQGPIPGVTSVCGKLAKPALFGWAGKVCGNYVLNHWDELAAAEPAQRFEAVSKAAARARDEAGDRGRRIHALAEGIVRGEDVDTPAELIGPATALADWFDRWQVQPRWIESVIASYRYGYAGTLDLVADVAGSRWLFDIKSGSNVYPDVALQLAGYRYAEKIIGSDGVEVDMPAVDACAVIHVLPDAVRVVPVRVSPEDFRTFLHLLQVHRWEAAEDSPLGVPMDTPPGPPRLEVVK